MSTTSEYFTQEEGINGVFYKGLIGWICIVVGIVGLLIGHTLAYPFTIGILLLVVARWLRKNPLVTLRQDHLEMKVALIAPRRLIRYREISEVEEAGHSKAWLNLRDGKRIRLPMQALEETKRSKLLQELHEMVGAGAKMKSSSKPGHANLGSE